MKVKKLFTIAIPASLVALIAMVLVVEAAFRATWDPSRGRPGFFVSDPVRIEKLSNNYDGWFAGVPVHLNGLGFRDPREYRLEKGPRTFRILVLGDSVTFGHGCIYEHTYPYLLEQRLRGWKPDVDWQVWNLGVPGYNTSQELAYLLQIGPTYRPDLVIVGFFGNDVVENGLLEPPTRKAIVASAVKTWLKRHMYSFDWYRKEYLTLRYRLLASRTERELLDDLAAQDQLLARPSGVDGLLAQALKKPAPRADADVERERCTHSQITTFSMQGLIGRLPGFEAWKAAVRRFQELHRTGTYRITFFVNHAPDLCRNKDEGVFDPRASKPRDDFYLQVLSDGTLAVSSHDAFLRYRPSQVPNAGTHSLGNANDVKAGVLFDFLRDHVLPPLVAHEISGP
jgi:hypothetical protein